MQLDKIKAHRDPRQFITTNMMGFFDGYDHYTVSQDLDLASWDDYVGTGQLDPVRNGATHDLTRGFLRKNFWVMETQPGFVNWSKDNNALNKGEVRAMAWHDIGHGADAVSYWQWRSALNGQEEYHGTLIGPDGTPVPLYAEVAQVGKEFERGRPGAEREPSRTPRLRCCTRTIAIGRSTGRGTIRHSIRSRRCSATTDRCGRSFTASTSSRRRYRSASTSWSSHPR